MTSPGGNIVEIRVISRDMSGPGFASAEARARGLAKSVASGPGSVAGAMQEADRKATGLGGTLRRVGEVAGGVLVAGVVQQMAQRAVALVHSTAAAASNLGESVNAVNQTFEDGAAAVLEWGQANANSIGLSQRAFNQSATVLGAMLKNQGLAMDDVTDHTTRLTERAADMASVFNTEVTDALAAIQAGLRGEIDPLERYGVSLSAAAVEARALADSGKTATRELTAQDKALARLAVLYEQTEQVAGDFRDTSDGLANSQRISTAQIEDAKAKIGTAFMPVLAKAAQLTGMFAETFSKLPGPVQATTVGLVALTAAIGFLAPMVVSAQTALASLNAQLALTGPMGAKAAGGLRAVTAAAGPVGAVLAAAGLSYSYFSDRMKDDKPLSNLEKLGRALFTTPVGMWIWDKVTEGPITAAKKLDAVVEAMEDVEEAADGAAKSVDELDKEFDDLIESAFALEDAQDAAAGAIEKLNEQLKQQKEDGVDGAGSLTGNTEAARENREAVRDLVQTYKDLMVEAQRSGQETDGLAQALEDQLVDMGFAREEAKRYVQQLKDLEAELKKLAYQRIQIDIVENRRRGTGYQEFAHGGITGAAGGGPRSRQTLVGEHGPEIVDLAPGSMVHSNGDSMRMAAQGGGGTDVTLSVKSSGSALIDRILNEISAEVQRRGGDGSVLGIRTVRG